MFRGVSDSPDQNAGGVGIHPQDYFLDANRGPFSQSGRDDGKGYPDACAWRD